MIKIIISFIITLVFSGLAYSSFFTIDYPNLLQWKAHYETCKALQRELEKGTLTPEDMIAQLKEMSPDRAMEIEDRFSKKYGNVGTTMKSVKFSLHDEAGDDTPDTSDDVPDESPANTATAAHADKKRTSADLPADAPARPAKRTPRTGKNANGPARSLKKSARTAAPATDSTAVASTEESE